MVYQMYVSFTIERLQGSKLSKQTPCFLNTFFWGANNTFPKRKPDERNLNCVVGHEVVLRTQHLEVFKCK